MAEEVKKEEKNENAKKMGATVLKVILGLLFLGLGVLMIVWWWPALKTVVKGTAGLFFVLAGLITLAIAKE